MISVATTVAFICGTVAGFPQIARMVRQRSSASQSAVGWAVGASGAGSTAYVGFAAGAPATVYTPSVAGAGVAIVGLGVTLYFARPRLVIRSLVRVKSASRFVFAARARR